jgi:hypothetical protein
MKTRPVMGSECAAAEKEISKRVSAANAGEMRSETRRLDRAKTIRKFYPILARVPLDNREPVPEGWRV